MKHEARPTIHMEKQLGWAHELGLAESQGMSLTGQTMLARLMVSQIWHPLTGSVGGRVQKRNNGLACLDVRYFSFSLYATVAFQTATLVLELRGSESE